eukprot:COSAG05_NODE_266_length_12619_cov_81.601677_2_plen_473_part_00
MFAARLMQQQACCLVGAPVLRRRFVPGVRLLVSGNVCMTAQRPAMGMRAGQMAGRPSVAARAFASAAKPSPPNATLAATRLGTLAKDAAVRAVPLVQGLATRLSASWMVRIWAKQVRKAADAGLEVVGSQWNAHAKAHSGKVAILVTVVCTYWVLRRLVDFVQVFLKNVESSFVYVLQLSTLFLAVLATMHMHGRLHLSGGRAHKLATRLVRTSGNPVVAERLGSKIRADSMRIVTRSGGNFRLVWPQSPEEEMKLAEKAEALRQSEAAKEQMATATAAADNGSTPAATAAYMPARLLAPARRRLAKLRLRLRILWAKLHVPYPEYRPAKAQLVFPVSGTLGKAMVSVQVTKHAGGLNGIYTFQLLALDFVDNKYELLYGDEEAYKSEVGAQLRLPMVTWLTQSNLIEAEEEQDDEAAEAAEKEARRVANAEAVKMLAATAKRAQETAAASRAEAADAAATVAAAMRKAQHA